MSRRRESRPEKRVVVCELAAQENGGHGSSLGMGRRLKKLGELEDKGVGMGLFTEVEEGLGVRSLLVGGGHKV